MIDPAQNFWLPGMARKRKFHGQVTRRTSGVQRYQAEPIQAVVYLGDAPH